MEWQVLRMASLAGLYRGEGDGNAVGAGISFFDAGE